MAGYQIKKMNWVRLPTAYESMKAWRERHRAAQEKYEANLTNAVSALQTAWVDQGLNVGEIAAKRAMTRMSEEAKIKQEKLAAAKASEASRIDPPKQSVYARNSSSTLDGGSRIDLSSNTLTLSDGTTIDLKTGLKKIDLTV